jgi:hypothetical protein
MNRMHRLAKYLIGGCSRRIKFRVIGHLMRAGAEHQLEQARVGRCKGDVGNAGRVQPRLRFHCRVHFLTHRGGEFAKSLRRNRAK